MRKIQSQGPYNVVGYSYGGAVAYEMARQLENSGETVNLICVDGSPAYIFEHTRAYKIRKNIIDVDSYESTAGLYLRFMSLFTEFDPQKVSRWSYE